MAKYIAGWNMPGYLPEMEPAEFETFDDAQEFIIDVLHRQEDDSAIDGNDDTAEYFLGARLDAEDETGPFTTSEMPDGYVYWVDIAE